MQNVKMQNTFTWAQTGAIVLFLLVFNAGMVATFLPTRDNIAEASATLNSTQIEVDNLTKAAEKLSQRLEMTNQKMEALTQSTQEFSIQTERWLKLLTKEIDELRSNR